MAGLTGCAITGLVVVGWPMIGPPNSELPGIHPANIKWKTVFFFNLLCSVNTPIQWSCQVCMYFYSIGGGLDWLGWLKLQIYWPPIPNCTQMGFCKSKRCRSRKSWRRSLQEQSRLYSLPKLFRLLFVQRDILVCIYISYFWAKHDCKGTIQTSF